MLHRLEATGPARRVELRLGLLGMVLVRDHDCSMWAIDKPESHRGINGVLIQTMAFIYVFPSSLSFAVSTRVGNELGGNRPYKAKLSAVELR